MRIQLENVFILFSRDTVQTTAATFSAMLFQPKASICLVPGKSKLFSFNYTHQMEHLDPLFASLGFNARCWRSNLSKHDG